MAKTAPVSVEPADRVQERYGPATVETAIKRINRALARGRSSNKTHGKSLYGNRDETIPKFAAERGLRRDSVERSRQFARLVSQKDVNEICRKCRNSDFPLGVTLIYRSLAIRDPHERMELLERVIDERWTLARLGVEIRKRTGAKTRSGRPRALPASRIETRQQIVARLSPHLHWLQALKSHRDGEFIGGLEIRVNAAISALTALLDIADNSSPKKPR